MAFTADLHLLEFVLPVLEFHWAVVQSVDEHGRPSGFTHEIDLFSSPYSDES